MKKKLHTSTENPQTVNEPEAVYETSPSATVDKWNPSKPFHGTQEEWWAHFREIEKGKFTSVNKANQEFEEWKEQYLKSRL